MTYRVYKNGVFERIVHESREETLEAVIQTPQFIQLPTQWSSWIAYGEVLEGYLVNTYVHIPWEDPHVVQYPSTTGGHN